MSEQIVFTKYHLDTIIAQGYSLQGIDFTGVTLECEIYGPSPANGGGVSGGSSNSGSGAAGYITIQDIIPIETPKSRLDDENFTPPNFTTLDEWSKEGTKAFAQGDTRYHRYCVGKWVNIYRG